MTTISYRGKYRTGNNCTVKTLWGLAKSPELHMDDESLHALVFRETGKESIRQLTKRELSAVCGILQKQKDGIRYQAGELKRPKGNPATERQRKKITSLEKALGWDTDKSRLRGMVKRMFKVDTVEWLTYTQCSALIEALKAMYDREAESEHE